METQIHNIEQEAYASVLRAFKAQSDAVTWVLLSQFIGLSFYNEVCWIVLTMTLLFLCTSGKRKFNYRA